MSLLRGIKVVFYSVMCSSILMYIFFDEEITLCNDIVTINPLNAELNPICHFLALLGGATIVVVSRLRVKVNQTQHFLLRKQCYLHRVAPCSQLLAPSSGATNTKYVKEGNIKKSLSLT